MNILVDIGHPAHVHLFRHPITSWLARNHRVVIAIRDRDIVASLLDAYGLSYTVASKARKTFGGLLYELVEHDWHVLRLALKHRSQVLIGSSISITHVSKLISARSITFGEDDVDYVKSFAWLAYPFADTIVTPDCLRDRRTAKYVTYKSYHELAYLHPNHYTPDGTILSDLKVEKDEPFFILRMVALRAHHDIGQSGLSKGAKKRLIDLLSERGKVFITAEGDIPPEYKPYQLSIPPHRIHDAMYYATMLISDSQTMTIEAAVLGTPAIRCNTFVGRSSVLEELESRYRLAYGFLPHEEEKMIDTIQNLLAMPNLRAEWHSRRAVLLQEKIDAAQWITDFVENYPTSFWEYQKRHVL